MKRTSQRRTSLTQQLFMGIGLPLIVVIALIGGIAYLSAVDEISEVYDSQMITSANILWSLSQDKTGPSQVKIRSEDLGLDADDQDALDEYSSWRSFRLWRSGRLLIASENAGTDMPGGPGFRDVHAHDGQWRVFTLSVPKDKVVVEVRESYQARNVVVWRIVWGLLLPLLAALPIIALVIWLAIRWGLRDLKRFAAVIAQRSFDDLSRIEPGTMPVEVHPVAHSVNHLLGKLQGSLDQERLFTDNAAHELRTPLATLSVQADVIQNARTAADRRQAVNELAKGVNRAGRLLDQLLTLARLRHAPFETMPLNLYQQASDAIKDIYPQAHKKGIELTLAGDETAIVASKGPLLAILLSNLLDNAIKYSPPGSRVAVEVQATGFTVTDQGPGIPEAERDQVFLRFYRLKGTMETGSGLGLSIVRTICDILPARVDLFTPETGKPGLGVGVRFS